MAGCGVHYPGYCVGVAIMTPVNRNYRGMFFVGCSVVLSACAQLLMKSGMLELSTASELLSRTFALESLYLPVVQTTILWVVAGLSCYAVSMLFWMAALARYELSLAYPMLSLSYVLVYIGAVYLPSLHESVTALRSGGIVLIVIGVILVTRSRSVATGLSK